MPVSSSHHSDDNSNTERSSGKTEPPALSQGAHRWLAPVIERISQSLAPASRLAEGDSEGSGDAPQSSPSSPIFPGAYPIEPPSAACIPALEGSPKLPQNIAFHYDPPSSPASKKITPSAIHGAGTDAISELRDESHKGDEQRLSTAPPPQRHHRDPPFSESSHVFGNSSTRYKGSEPDVISSQSSTPQSTNRYLNSSFQGAQDVKIDNSQFQNVGKQKIIYNYGGTYGLDLLKDFVCFNALHDSFAQDPQRRCHPGTRENVLKQIHRWIDNPDTAERILWLYGPAGVGKSAIAQTIAHSHSRRKVAATFFFYRSDASRNDGNRLFPTLAWQLAKSLPGARDGIADALNDDCDLPRKALEIQFEDLISRPFQAISDTFPGVQTSAPVVVIDGVDECLDDKLQRRFLKVICSSVTSGQCPLRFVIASRPEAHIQEAFDPFKNSTQLIDLADVDGAYHDIEKYLTSEFSRIASEQQLDPSSWPGPHIIEQFVSKSSGQFVYAATIVKFIGDEYNDATSHLNILLGLEPIANESPFADLDALYIEILQRQRHQKFLQDFLAIFVACDEIDVFDYNLGLDDALLLYIDEKGLHRKLRGMHSVLKIKPGSIINVHHRSFLDFLQESSRSHQYHVNKQRGRRRYLELIVECLVRYASRVMKDPDYHGVDHFAPAFGDAIRECPRAIDLPLQDWEDILQPLLDLRDEMLKTPHLNTPWKRGTCAECSIFYIIDDLLLHLFVFRGTSDPLSSLPRLEESSAVLSSSPAEELQSLDGNLDGCLSLLLAVLRDEELRTPVSRKAVHLVCTILDFGFAETASKICNVSDAQNLVDFILYLVSNKRFFMRWNSRVASNASLLALEIYARIPVVPRALFLNEINLRAQDSHHAQYQGKVAYNSGYYGVNPMCQSIILVTTLSHNNILPFLGICVDEQSQWWQVYDTTENVTLHQWQQSSNPPIAEIQGCLLDVARAIQHIHSLGIVLDYIFDGRDVYINSNLEAQIMAYGLSLRYLRETPTAYVADPVKDKCSYEWNVFFFGCLYYEILFNDRPRKDIVNRPSKPEINENTSQLIQRCCAENPEDRPSIDEVVEEMQSWE